MSIDIDDLTLGQLKEIASKFGGNSKEMSSPLDNGMVGKYVIVRCRDAGVHSGILDNYNGRECVLTESRRLWWWKAKQNAFLSGVATFGLSDASKIGVSVDRIHLTENCEIILCSKEAEKSIRGAKDYAP